MPNRDERCRARSSSDASQVQKHQKVEIDESLHRPHGLRHEVALPERLRVDRQEFVPRSRAPLWSRIKTVFLQDDLTVCREIRVIPSLRSSPRIQV
jgi:hypothetical protein